MLAPLLVAGLSLAPSQSLGDELTVTWTAPEGCPSQAQLLRLRAEHGAEHGASNDHDAESGGLLAAHAAVLRTPDGNFALQAKFVSSSGNWTRELQDSDCARLGEAFVVLIGLEDDAQRLVQTTPAHQRSDPEPPQGKLSATRERNTGFPGGQSWSIGVSTSGDIGLQPGLAAGLGMHVSYTQARFHGALRSRLSFPTRTRFATGDEAELGLQNWLTGLDLCFRLPTKSQLLVPLCGFVELGPMFASGHNSDADTQVVHLAANFGLAAALHLQLGERWRAGLGLHAGLQSLRPQYRISGIDAGYRSPLAFVRLRLSTGLVWRQRSRGRV